MSNLMSTFLGRVGPRDRNSDDAADLFFMTRSELQGTVLKHSDPLREYWHIDDKLVMLLDVRGDLHDLL